MQPKLTNLKQWKYMPLVEQVKSAPLVNENVLTILRLFVINHMQYLKPTEYAQIAVYFNAAQAFLDKQKGTCN